MDYEHLLQSKEVEVSNILDKQKPDDRSFQKRREPSRLIAGKGKIHGDIIAAKIPEENRGSL